MPPTMMPVFDFFAGGAGGWGAGLRGRTRGGAIGLRVRRGLLGSRLLLRDLPARGLRVPGARLAVPRVLLGGRRGLLGHRGRLLRCGRIRHPSRRRHGRLPRHRGHGLCRLRRGRLLGCGRIRCGRLGRIRHRRHRQRLLRRGRIRYRLRYRHRLLGHRRHRKRLGCGRRSLHLIDRAGGGRIGLWLRRRGHALLFLFAHDGSSPPRQGAKTRCAHYIGGAGTLSRHQPPRCFHLVSRSPPIHRTSFRSRRAAWRPSLANPRSNTVSWSRFRCPEPTSRKASDRHGTDR